MKQVNCIQKKIKPCLINRLIQKEMHEQKKKKKNILKQTQTEYQFLKKVTRL